MVQASIRISFSMEWWRAYQDLFIRAITSLTTEQLTYRLGTQRSAGEIAAHIVSVRAWYLHGVMGEGGPDTAALIDWDKPDAPLRSSAELLVGIDQTWQLLTGCLAHWSDEDMQHNTFYINWRERHEPRGWVVWHMLEHEIHHGGELSFTLGSFGLAGVDV